MGNDDSIKYHPIEDQVFVQIFQLNDTFDANENDETEMENATSTNSATSSEDVVEIVYITFMLIGVVFLFLTAFLYLLIWEKHNIHGWTIFAFVCTMMLMFIFLAISKISSLTWTRDEFGESSTCTAYGYFFKISLNQQIAGIHNLSNIMWWFLGILSHFFYLATICWLTVINVDLWLTFRNVKPSGGKSQSVKRFILYSFFAFGIPFCIVGFGVTIDKVYQG